MIFLGQWSGRATRNYSLVTLWKISFQGRVRCLPKALAFNLIFMINGLADHHIWSTIKILPATLTEASFMGVGLKLRLLITKF